MGVEQKRTQRLRREESAEKMVQIPIGAYKANDLVDLHSHTTRKDCWRIQKCVQPIVVI